MGILCPDGNIVCECKGILFPDGNIVRECEGILCSSKNIVCMSNCNFATVSISYLRLLAIPEARRNCDSNLRSVIWEHQKHFPKLLYLPENQPTFSVKFQF